VYVENVLYKKIGNPIKRFFVTKEKLKEDCNHLRGKIKLDKKLSKKDVLVFDCHDEELSKYILRKGNLLGEVVGEFVLEKHNSNIVDADEVRLFGVRYENLEEEIKAGELSFYTCGDILYIIKDNSILVSLIITKEKLQ